MKSVKINKWFCVIADSWNDNKAPWAYVNGKSMSVKLWNYIFNRAKGDLKARYIAADNAVIKMAVRHSVYLIMLLWMGCASSKLTIDWHTYPHYELLLEGQGLTLTIKCDNGKVAKVLYVGKDWHFNKKTIDFFAKSECEK